MTTLRHRLHLWVAAWLIFQVATLSALVPRDCCAAHKSQHTQRQQAANKGDHASHHGMTHEMPQPTGTCVMRGTCQGPMSAILALLSNQGVPPVGSFTIALDLRVTLFANATRELVASRLASPDPPPPRA